MTTKDMCHWCSEPNYQAVVKPTTDVYVGGKGPYSIERL